jgi:hypothetical protein
MRRCGQCGLSIGERATYCPVCGARVGPEDAAFAVDLETTSAASFALGDNGGLCHDSLSTTAQAVDGSPQLLGARQDEGSSHESAVLCAQEAGRCEKADGARAAALYRQAIVEFLESDEDPLDSPYVRGQVLFAFDRLSLVLKRSDLTAEALEEIDSAASLGLLDRQDTGTKTRREALSKRRTSLRRTLASDHA